MSRAGLVQCSCAMPAVLDQWDSWSLPVLIAIFAGSSVVVWQAGTRLSRACDALAGKTRLGQAFLGALLLGGATSLPEIVTTATAATVGAADLAVSNVMGGIAMQVAILAMADLALGGGAISGRPKHPDALLQGALLVLVLAVAVAGMIVGDRLVLGFGVCTAAVLLLVIGGLYLIEQYEKDRSWEPVEEGGEPRRPRRSKDGLHDASLAKIALYIGGAAGTILVAGYALTRSGEEIASQIGLTEAFAGAVLIAIATSLPEVSTTFEAVRIGKPLLAFAGIFGTNLFDAAMLFVADLVFAGPPVLDAVSSAAPFAGLLAIACTAIYLVGLVERSEIRLGRGGIDSIAVVIAYGLGLWVLYGLD